MRVFPVFSLCVLLFSCSQKESKAQQTPSKNKISLEILNGAGDIGTGCSEMILAEKDTIGSNKFLFLSNFTDFGIVKLNGQKITLQKDTVQSKRVNENQYISAYKKDDLKVILNLSLEKAYDEGGVYKGKMTILKGNERIERNVHGECGC